MSAKRLAICAVTTALLLALQISLGYVVGVELVTVFLLAFCYVFGVRCGVLTATAFSLVRCLVYGFFVNALVLYLVYYNLFAVLFGVLGRRRAPEGLCPLLLVLLAAACAYFAAAGLPVSVLFRPRLTVMLWIAFGLLTALALFYGVLRLVRRGEEGRELASVTALAVFCTALFTLLDDAITPLFGGYSPEAALVYFYNGFLAMIPQMICAAVSVFLLFLPLKKIFSSFCKRAN